jgi:capsular polysaccharide biosynthesis protein
VLHQEVDPVVNAPSSRGRAGLVVSLVVVLLLSVGVALVAGAVQRSRPTVYASTAQLLIDQEPALALSRDDALFLKLVRLRTKYADVLSTTSFSDKVAARLNLDPGEVHSSLAADVPQVSLLLGVRATAKYPDAAQRLAQAAAEGLQQELTDEQATLKIPADLRITLAVASPAGTGQRISSSRSRENLVSAIAGLAVLSGGLVVVAAVRRRSA